MLKTLLVALAVGVVTCEPSCNRMDRLVVKEQWTKAFGSGTNREEFGIALFNEFFSRSSEAKDKFARVRGDNVYSAEFKAHITRLLGGIDMCISFLDDEATLNAQLAHLSKQHEPRAISKELFTLFGQTLDDVIPSRIGRCYNQDAWHGCFKVILDGIGAYLG